MRVIFKSGQIAELANVESIIIDDAPKKEEEPVSGLANWIFNGDYAHPKSTCNNCKLDSKMMTKFCPHCGFKMRNYNERLYSALTRPDHKVEVFYDDSTEA